MNYHARQLGVVSKTALDQLAISPAHYRAWLAGYDHETPALMFGKALHMAVLEPDKFGATYVVEPDFGDCRYKAAKEERDAWRSANLGKKYLSAEDSQTIESMSASVRAHPTARKLLTGGASEVEQHWVDAETGLTCKCLADYHRKAMLVDLKSALDASPAGFRKAIASHRYHVQDALYREGFRANGIDIRHFAFVAVEKTPPFAVGVYVLDQEAYCAGVDEARRLMALMRQCIDSNNWPAYSPDAVELSLPPWALR